MGVNGLIDWRVESGGERESFCVFRLLSLLSEAKVGWHTTHVIYTQQEFKQRCGVCR